MAKKIEIGNVGLSKDGTRLVMKLEAEEIIVKAYDGSTITKTKGDYLDVAQFDEVLENYKFLLKNDYIKQDLYDNKVGYMEKIKESFRAKLSVRNK